MGIILKNSRLSCDSERVVGGIATPLPDATQSTNKEKTRFRSEAEIMAQQRKKGGMSRWDAPQLSRRNAESAVVRRSRRSVNRAPKSELRRRGGHSFSRRRGPDAPHEAKTLTKISYA